MHDIDFVITYLDGNDVEWQKEKNKYTPGSNSDANPHRFRNWNNLQYLFRGIEKFAPWVRKVHVVTCGHVPAWLNTNHPKVNIVKHSDYIPDEWLPTFSSRCIDMNLHRIPGLAEHFVYFNDDMFITKPVKPKDFFVNGLPCDSAIMRAWTSTERKGFQMYTALLADIGLINKYFNKRGLLLSNPTKWFNLKYGVDLLSTMTMLPYPRFVGFRFLHLPYSYQKHTYEEVWKLEEQRLSETSSHKFRELSDPNHLLFTYWQYVTGEFHPRSTSFGRMYPLVDKNLAEVARRDILAHRYKTICLNDAVNVDETFDEVVQIVNGALATVLPEKSAFEI